MFISQLVLSLVHETELQLMGGNDNKKELD